MGKENKVNVLTRLAIFTAIIIIMAFTPLGYLKVGPLSITFLVIPVVLGAIMLSPKYGAILGVVFGLTSFAQCFGMDPFGTALLSINPFLTFLLCIIPRALIGIVSGYVLVLFKKMNLNDVLSFAISGLLGALTNTVFFVGFLILFFGNTDYIRSFGDTIFKVITVLITTNSIIECIVATILVTAIAKAFKAFLKGKSF